MPILCQFGEFASAKGAIDGQSALAHVESFAQYWASIHGKSCKSDVERAKVTSEARNAARQMLELALYGSVGPHRLRKPFAFEAEVPGFAGYLAEQRVVVLDQLDSRLIEAFLVSRPRERPRSHNHLVGAIRRFFDWAVVQGVAERNPVNVRPRRETAQRIPYALLLCSDRDTGASTPPNLPGSQTPTHRRRHSLTKP